MCKEGAVAIYAHHPFQIYYSIEIKTMIIAKRIHKEYNVQPPTYDEDTNQVLLLNVRLIMERRVTECKETVLSHVTEGSSLPGWNDHGASSS